MERSAGRWLEVYAAVLRAQAGEMSSLERAAVDGDILGWFRDHLIAHTDVTETDLARRETEVDTELENRMARRVAAGVERVLAAYGADRR